MIGGGPRLVAVAALLVVLSRVRGRGGGRHGLELRLRLLRPLVVDLEVQRAVVRVEPEKRRQKLQYDTRYAAGMYIH